MCSAAYCVLHNSSKHLRKLTLSNMAPYLGDPVFPIYELHNKKLAELEKLNNVDVIYFDFTKKKL